MRNPSSWQNWYNVQGFSKARLLVVVLLTILAGVGAFSKLRRDTLERTRQVQVERVAQIQLALRKDVQLCLVQVQKHLELEETDEATRELRRASILDSNSEFSAKVHELKIGIIQNKQAIAHRIELEKLRSSILAALQLEQLTDASELLLKYSKIGMQDVAYLALKEKYDAAVQRNQQLEEHSEGFSRAITSWDETQATHYLSALRRLETKPEELTEMAGKLDQLRKIDRTVSSVVQEIQLKDSGEYSAHLLEKVESEIERLGEHPKLMRIHQKLLSNPQIVRVPADVSTLDEAYSLLRKGGTIELGEGVFYVELEINKPVIIKGAGVGITIIESRTVNGSGLHFFHPKKDSKVSHLSLRGFISEAGKYPLVLLRGGGLDLSHVEISGSANHGMAVSRGLAKIEHCRFSGNHWDGLAVFGPTSSVHVKESSFQKNADHGVDAWGGATALLESSVIERNSKSGIVVSGVKSLVTLVDVHSSANRECGIYLNLGASLTAERVEVSNNHFSGLVAQRINLLEWIKSDASSNGEFGYLMDRQSMEVFDGEFVGKENKLGLRSQKRLK